MIDNSWIKLYRKVQNSWIFNNPHYFKAWMQVLMNVNHTPRDVTIKSQLIHCDRGQKAYSIDTWADVFNKDNENGSEWTTQKVRTFFKKLEKTNMIITENLGKTTRLTVCNYRTYQDVQLTDNKQITNIKLTDN